MKPEEVYIQMYQTLTAIEDELKTLPEGWIEKQRVNGQEYEYYRYWKDGKKCCESPEAFDQLRTDLDRRKHLSKQKSNLMNEMKSYRKTLRELHLNPASIIRKYNTEQKHRLNRQLKDFQAIEKALRKKYSQGYKVPTLNHEQVASKSEMIIANALFRNHINYQYEAEIKLSNYILHPDFVIIYKGKMYIWEHLGRMDDPEYVKKWNWKKDLYEKNGFLPFVTLIITTETLDEPLFENQVENIIKTYFS